MSTNTSGELRLRLTNESSPEDINVVLAILRLNQYILADEMEVTQGAISQAINKYSEVQSLRDRIIERLNSLQGYGTEDNVNGVAPGTKGMKN